MSEKKGIIEFVKDNRKKIIKGAVIAAGLVAGLVVIRGLVNHTEKLFVETIETFVPGNSTTLEAINDVIESA